MAGWCRCRFPIPDSRSPIRYGEVGGEGRDIGRLVSNLTNGRIRRSSRAHLDPDLVASDYPRVSGWRPLFGQEGAAMTYHREAALWSRVGASTRLRSTARGQEFVLAGRAYPEAAPWLRALVRRFSGAEMPRWRDHLRENS